MERNTLIRCLAASVSFAVLVMALALLPNALSQAAAQEPAPTQSTNASIRLVHASPDAGPVDIYVYLGGVQVPLPSIVESLLQNVPFTTISPYVNLPAGTYEFRIVPAGGDPETDAVLSPTLTLDAGMYYTAAAVGLVNSPPAGKELQAVFLEDTVFLPETGNAALNVYHFSTLAPTSVDVFAEGVADPLISDLNFPTSYVDPGTDPSNEPLVVPSASYTLTVTAADDPTPALTIPDLALAGEQFYSVFVFDGFDGDDNLTQVNVVPWAEYTRVRFVHASPNAPGVELYANEEPSPIANSEVISYFTVTDYETLLTNAATYALRLPGDSTDVVTEPLQLYEGGKYYTLAAVGLVGATGDQALDLIVLEDNRMQPPEGQSRVNVYHFAPDVPPVDLSVTDGPTLLSGLAYKESSNDPPPPTDIVVPAATYDLTVTPDGVPTGIPITNVTIASDLIYDVFAIGTFDIYDPYELSIQFRPEATGSKIYLPVIITTN